MAPNKMMLPESTGLPNAGMGAPPELNAPQMGGRRKSGRRKSGRRRPGRRRTGRRMNY